MARPVWELTGWFEMNVAQMWFWMLVGQSACSGVRTMFQAGRGGLSKC